MRFTVAAAVNVRLARFLGASAAFVLLGAPVAAQTSDDERSVRQAIEDYFAGITDYDAEALDRAFASDAVIQSYLPAGRVYRRPYSDWRSLLRRGRPADADQYQNRIVSVDIAGTAASVKTDLLWPRVRYIDYLSLLKIDGQWKIVSKIWYQEAPGGGGI